MVHGASLWRLPSLTMGLFWHQGMHIGYLNMKEINGNEKKPILPSFVQLKVVSLESNKFSVKKL